MFFLPKAKKKSTKIKAQIPEPDLAIHTMHFAVNCVLDRFTMQEIYNWKLSFISRHTDIVKLWKKRLASSLSWPHYKFKCSEIHEPRINEMANEPSAYASCLHLVLSRISIATKNFLTHVRSFWCMQSWTFVSHRLPLYWKTLQANVMTSQLPICSRRSDGQSSTRNTFAFKDSLNRTIHNTFGSCRFVIDAQTNLSHTDQN